MAVRDQEDDLLGPEVRVGRPGQQGLPVPDQDLPPAQAQGEGLARLALPTSPPGRALLAGGALAAAGLLWATRGAVLVLPFFYPYLIGHLPWAIVLCALAACALAGWYAWKHRARHWAVRAAGVYLALFAVLMLSGRLAQSSKLRWLAWHASGAGLSAGLSRAEVETTLSSRAKLAAPCVPGGCSYAPRGLAALAFTVMEVYGVDTDYGPDGKLVSWKTWSD